MAKNPLHVKKYAPFFQQALPVPATPVDGGVQRQICISEDWIPIILGALEPLRWPDVWTGSEAEKETALKEVQKLLLAFLEGCDAQEVGCREYAPDSHILAWNPIDPFQTPNDIPTGYLTPPWYAVTDPALYQSLIGVKAGDVYTDISVFVTAQPSQVLSGYPRFQFQFSGAGLCVLHLLRIPGGGIAQIYLDGTPIKTVDLDILTPANMESYLSELDIFFGSDFTPPAVVTLVAESAVEIETTTGGNHSIEVKMLPRITNGTFTGFGGGLRKLQLCDNLEAIANPVPQFNLDPDGNLYWKPYIEATNWTFLGNIQGQDGTDGQNAPIPAFTWNGDILQIDADANGSVDSNSINLTGPPGPQGLQGPAGICPDCDGITPVPTDTAPPNDIKLCNKATGLAGLIMGRLEQAYQTFDSSGTALNALYAHRAAYPTIAWKVDKLLSLFNVIEGQGTTVMRSHTTNALQDALKCAFYCEFNGYAGLDSTEYQAMLTAATETAPNIVMEYAIQYLLEAIPMSTWQTDAWLMASTRSDDCSECECVEWDWEHTFNFVNSSGSPYVNYYDWEQSLVTAQWQAGTGWKAANYQLSGEWKRDTGIIIDWSSQGSREILEVEWTISKYSPDNQEDTYMLYDALNGSHLIPVTSPVNNADLPASVTWQGSRTTSKLVPYYFIDTRVNEGDLTQDNVYIQSLTIRGKGTNPFV